MTFYIIQLIMLALAYKLHLMKKEPYFCALLFSIPLAIIGVLFGKPLVGVFIGSSILFFIGFLCFWLMQKLPRGNSEYAVLAGTAAALLILEMI